MGGNDERDSPLELRRRCSAHGHYASLKIVRCRERDPKRIAGAVSAAAQPAGGDSAPRILGEKQRVREPETVDG
jgi:hypothetical protein